MKNPTIIALSILIVMIAGNTTRALDMTTYQGSLQTTNTEPQMRKISLKLPLKQPRFHWTFMSKEDFLAGKLILRIKQGDVTNEIKIFENGELSKGWEAMTCEIPRAGEIYFGFNSSQKYATEPNDILEIELHVIKDLDGIGAFQTGVLPKGVYKAMGGYSVLMDEYKIPPESVKGISKEKLDELKKMFDCTAFLENWKQQWNLTITSEEGWLPPDKRKALEKIIEQRKQEEK